MKTQHKKLSSYKFIIEEAEREERKGNYYLAENLYKIGLEEAKKEKNEEKIKVFHGLLFSFI